MKQKRDKQLRINSLILAVQLLLIALMFALMLVNMIISIISPDNQVCFNIDDTALIVYGTENNRDKTTTSQMAINILSEITQDTVITSESIIYKPLDVALYNKHSLIGTLLFMQLDNAQWVVQVNNASRQDCGLFEISQHRMIDFIVLAGVG